MASFGQDLFIGIKCFMLHVQGKRLAASARVCV